jgi:isopentenyldiphosphate isomerase/intracellular septation protein A
VKFDRKILLSLLPGLLPLFIFVIADNLWGEIIGLYVAIGFGIGELVFTYIKTRKIEKFILLDLGLLISLGVVSVLLNNDIYFKLKPAFIELIFAALLGYSVFSSRNIIFEMSLRYMKGVNINPAAREKFNSSLRIILAITLFHIALVVYSSIYMSKEAWAFISGVLFYILILGYFGIDLLLKRYLRNDHAEEILPVVDENGNVIGKALRSDCHFNPNEKILHPVVHMHVINSRGEIYLQHRSPLKKVQPGKWDTAVGGHISFGEDLETGLRRETEEEIGLPDFNPRFIHKYIWETEVERELVFMFVSQADSGLKVNPDEISEGRFWSLAEIRENLGKGVFTPNFEKEFLIMAPDTRV